MKTYINGQEIEVNVGEIWRTKIGNYALIISPSELGGVVGYMVYYDFQGKKYYKTEIYNRLSEKVHMTLHDFIQFNHKAFIKFIASL